jgi:pimeloyl-ACP methyl ester carboxylesterase
MPVPAQDLGFRGRPKVVVIFVHGYHVGPTEALQDSSALWRHIRESNEQLRKTLRALPETDSVAFLTFLWRGDFVLFSDSQQAAKDTAPAFVDFLKTVLREAKGTRTVIVTHSLGAEVVLEALGSAAGLGSVVDGLILVQAAVPAYLLSRWTVSFQTGSDFLADVMIKPENREERRGRYAIATRSVRELVYTFSAKDEVLNYLFRFSEVWPAIFSTFVNANRLSQTFSASLPQSKRLTSKSLDNFSMTNSAPETINGFRQRSGARTGV